MDSQGFAAVDWFVFSSPFFAPIVTHFGHAVVGKYFFNLSLQSGHVLYFYSFPFFPLL
jgi:hypothetical protein